MPVFSVDASLLQHWTAYTSSNDEAGFRRFVRGLVQAWTAGGQAAADGHNLPEELLPALEKFLFVAKEQAEQSEDGGLGAAAVVDATDAVRCVSVACLCGAADLVASMDLVRIVTRLDAALLQQLLQMESSFFVVSGRKAAEAAAASNKLRTAIIAFIAESCHMLENIYDPGHRWKSFVESKGQLERANEMQRMPCQIALHQETIPFLYESFETALADCFPDLAKEFLNVFGAVISGSRHNATRAISPATSKMLLKTIRDAETNADVHTVAVYCSARSIQILQELPAEERQLELRALTEQYQNILTALAEKDTVSLDTLVEAVSLLGSVLRPSPHAAELQLLLAKGGMIEALLKIARECHLEVEEKNSLLPIVIDRIGLLLRDCDAATQRMAKIDGYREIFNIASGLGSPSASVLGAILSLASFCSGPSDSKMPERIRNVEPITYLLQWMANTDFDSVDLQVWLAESLRSLCSATIQNKMLCCRSGVIVELIKVLQSFDRLSQRSAVEILKLIESLGTHSISPYELKLLVALLKRDGDTRFPFKSHVIHVISSMAKSDGYEVCRQYFDVGLGCKGLSVPTVRQQWPGPAYGFTFHCWLRLDAFANSPDGHDNRRQLYSFYSSTGGGFEAFLSPNGVLSAAVAHKKEFLAVPLTEHHLSDGRWHCVQISHSAGKKPFGSSSVAFFVDGTKRLECPLKYPGLSGEPISYVQIGAPLQRGNVPALNPDHGRRSSIKDTIMDGIKIGLPGVINLPSALKSSQNDPHVKWTLIGLEDQLFGKAVSLCGQLGMVCCMQDSITASQAKLLYSLGPNQSLVLSAAEDNTDMIDLQAKAVFLYSPRACQNATCANLLSPQRLDAHVQADCFCTQDVKDVINCIGGVSALFPLLETAAAADDNEAADMGYLSLRDDSASDSANNSSSSLEGRRTSLVAGGGAGNAGDQTPEAGWELLPSSSFSDWKLEQNAISGFLTLVKNLVTNHTINTEQLMRGGGVAIIGALLQSARPRMIDVNVLMAAQLLVELAHASKDQKLQYQIYQSVLFDFRIWAKSEFHVQIGHIQYLSTIIKDDRKSFRKKFGVQFLLDTVRRHYAGPSGPSGPSGSPPPQVQQPGDALSREDCKTLRGSLFGLVKYFLQHDVSSRDVQPIVTFLLSEKNETLVAELAEMLTHFLDNRHTKDQVFREMLEPRKADLLYCLLINPAAPVSVKVAIMRLITSLLRTSKVPLRSKYRMHLAEARYVGFLHFWFRQSASSPVSPTHTASASISKQELLLLLDQMLLFDDPSSVQGILGLTHHLQLFPLDVKLDVARRLMTFLFSKPDVPASLARQMGWQDCVARLLVKCTLKMDEVEEESSDALGGADEATLSPSHYIERAASVAKSYLPQPAGEAVTIIGNVASKVASEATKNVGYAKDFAAEKVSSAQERVYSTVSRTQQILGKVQSGLDDFTERASFSRRRRFSGSSTASHRSDAAAPAADRPPTPQYLQAFDEFGFEDLAGDISSSSEDVSVACSTPTRAAQMSSAASIDHDIPDMEVINEELISREMANSLTLKAESHDDEEEELCNLVVNILFTIMWRGHTGASEEVIKERGQVIACINMLGLNNELYRSHVDLKRRLVELCVQAALSDFKDSYTSSSKQNNNGDGNSGGAIAQHVMMWVYDLVVLDPYGTFKKKVSEILLDGVLALLEKLVVFQETGRADPKWDEMAKMALDVLLKCAECCDEDEVCTMATAKLHTLIQTRENSSGAENGYLIQRISKIMQKSLAEGNSDHYLFLVPSMRALLEKSKAQLHLTTQLPSLNLRQTGTDFFEAFQAYCQGEEWSYFLEKKIAPLHDSYAAGFLQQLPREMDVFWAECFELSKVASHKRMREVGESKMRFQSKYLESFLSTGKRETTRYGNAISQQKSHLTFIRKRWKINKRLFFGPRGAWSDPEDPAAAQHWRLANNENYLRMRMKLVPNPSFDPHLEASASRDNVQIPSRTDSSRALLQLQISKEAVRSLDGADDSLTEDDLRLIAKEQMETASESSDQERQSEHLLMSEECQLVTFMSVIKGKFELTSCYAYFFDSSPYRENEERHDFRWNLLQLREMHLRRFNLRRTGIEFFLLDQTNYFLNFPTNRKRNKVYTRMQTLKLPNLVYSSSRSPSDLLKTSGLTEKWVNREITNFEYLMQLNTIAGRTFNDLSQYPVFPWILADYESEKLDLTNPDTFRDLSRPIGIQNEKHVNEVKAKYDNFEDPSGVIAKFHYGTHYSNSAMVLHYLVRVEPFTALHIELQSGRFDVADRQFHSVQQTWKSLYSNVNDVKELIPEFFYFPEFLQNLNDFDLGRLQTKKKKVSDVVLPKWAQNADDFIRKHRLALESEYVSSQLHNWIDLIFGHKQKGPAAVEAFNVFYYCSYEGAVDLDAIKDPSEREALEGMINNFGQTPCQLLKEAHPKRMSLVEYQLLRASSRPGALRTDIFLFTKLWKVNMVDVTDERDPVVFVQVPKSQPKSFMLAGTPDTMVTISSQLALGTHSWLNGDRSGQNISFSLELDPSATNAKTRRQLPAPLTPNLSNSKKLFAVSHDAKYVFSGGHWDNSLQAYSLSRAKTVSRVIRHIDVITCLVLDSTGNYIMSGSRDTTSIVWEVCPTTLVAAAYAQQNGPNPRPVQVLAGHDRAVSCVAISTELDMAVSGADDGTINVYTVKEGMYIRSIQPPSFGAELYTIDQMSLSYAGHVVFAGHSRDVHSLHVYTVNGHLLTSSSVSHRITAIAVAGDHVLTGDENGDLVLRDLLTPKVHLSMALHLPVQDVSVVAGNLHVLAPLRDGKMAVVGLKGFSH